MHRSTTAHHFPRVRFPAFLVAAAAAVPVPSFDAGLNSTSHPLVFELGTAGLPAISFAGLFCGDTLVSLAASRIAPLLRQKSTCAFRPSLSVSSSRAHIGHVSSWAVAGRDEDGRGAEDGEGFARALGLGGVSDEDEGLMVGRGPYRGRSIRSWSKDDWCGADASLMLGRISSSASSSSPVKKVGSSSSSP
jgi:hypothetical protein